MFKAVCLIRRKPGMTLPQFIERYENGHAVLCAQIIPYMVKYLRRYVQPGETVRYDGAPDLDFDVVTELWFESRGTYELAMAALNEPHKAKRLSADERELFDLTSIRRFIVEEKESQLGL
jgi:hypothetical protein